MKHAFWLLIGLVAIMALSAYAAFGESGPIGWINAGQTAMFGGYSGKIGMLVLMVVVGIPVVAIWAAVAPASLRRVFAAIEAPLAPRAATASVFKWLLSAWVVAIALVWIGAYGYGAWQEHVKRSDASAVYEPLELVPNMKDPAAGHDHLTIEGRLLDDHVVSRKSGSDSSAATLLVPLVEPTWRDGDPVHFVVRLGEGGELALQTAMFKHQRRFMVRTDGNVPTLASQVFERDHAPIASDAVAVLLVPEQDGAAAPAAGQNATGQVLIWGITGSGLVTLVVAMFAGATIGPTRRARKRTASEVSEVSESLDLVPSKDSTDMFRRYVPFGDGREVIVRSDQARLAQRFPPQRQRRHRLPSGREIVLTTIQELLSPPPLRPGQAPMSREAAAHYTPTYEFADLAGKQLCFKRHPQGFTTEEVDRFLAAFEKDAKA